MHALTPLLADTRWHHGWWIAFPIFWLLLTALLVALFWRRGRRRCNGGDSPRRILADRFARGEINGEEYRDRLSQLQ